MGFWKRISERAKEIKLSMEFVRSNPQAVQSFVLLILSQLAGVGINLPWVESQVEAAVALAGSVFAVIIFMWGVLQSPPRSNE